jgi:hypothetical protein
MRAKELRDALDTLRRRANVLLVWRPPAAPLDVRPRSGGLMKDSFRSLIPSGARMRDRVGGYHPTCPIALARWRQDRRAGRGILIESPPGELPGLW